MSQYSSIKELLSTITPNTGFSVTCIVPKIDSRITTTGKTMYNINLSDSTSNMNCIAWELPSALTNYSNKVFIIEGFCSMYRESYNFTIKNAIEITANYGDFIAKSPIPVENLIDSLNSFIKSIKNDSIRTAVNNIIHDRYDDFITYPAATRIHHNYKHGLLEHTVGVTTLSLAGYKLADPNKSIINSDYVLAGAILHDIGKLQCYKMAPNPVSTEQGNVLHHIAIGYIIVSNELDKYSDLNQIDKDNILHIILSHHGKKEYSSPVEPMTIEATIVYQSDFMDSSVIAAKSIISSIPSNSNFSAYSSVFEHKFWNGKYINQ